MGSVPAGTDIFITLFDEDENIDGTVFDTAEVTVTSLTTGDVETLTLTEIGTQSDEFSNTVGLPTAAGAAILGDGILQQDGSEDLLVSYTDNEDPGDTISGNLLAAPVVWDGEGTNNNWDTPQNWTGDEVPTFFDNVRFDATSSKDCVVTQFQEMLNLTIAAGYTGTISRSSSFIQVNGDLSVSGGNFAFSGSVVVSGNTTITGGTVDWRSTVFTGDVLINGGSVRWGGFHHFHGDYIRTGGTVTTAQSEFHFIGTGPQAFTIAAGGIALRLLEVAGGSSQVLDITGDITVSSTSSRTGRFIFAGSSTTNLDGRLTLNSGNTFTVSGRSTTLNVLDGSVVDATAAGSYFNGGRINEIGTGKVLRFTTGVGLTDPSGTIPVNKIDLGDPIFLLLFDEDENIDGNALDTTQITLTNLVNGDFETVTLTGPGNSSEKFFFAAGFPTAVGTAIIGNGILEAVLGNVIEIRYQDDEDAADVLAVFKAVTVPDCNSNGVDDLTDIAVGTSEDCDDNGVPDECQLPPIGDAPDCNNDGIPDLCQIINNDCNNNGVPDDCETFQDCNGNGAPDACDIFDGVSADCNNNGIPDECEASDCDGDGIPDECEPDCDNDGIPDDCEVDCNGNNIPDECETFTDCNNNGIPDECDVDPSDPDGNGEVSADVNGDGIPDECENQPPDCDAGGPYTVQCQGATTEVALDGSGSSDPDPGDTLTFSWSTDCPGASFDDATSATPTLSVDTSCACTVACNVTLIIDDGIETATCTIAVTISDTTAPVVTCSVTTDVLWSPDHKFVDVGLAVEVSDACDPAGAAASVTVEVWSDETEIPDTGDGTGRHAPDYKTLLESGQEGTFLRNERRARENGRVYLIIARAEDGSGNVSFGFTTVVVPHDQSQDGLNLVAAQAAADVSTILAPDYPPGTTIADVIAPLVPQGYSQHDACGCSLGPHQ